MSSSAVDARIRSLRPARALVDPYSAHGHVVEEERTSRGLERAVTVFLAGAECPFACSFCDLWRYTFDGPTPKGAIPSQLEKVLAELPGKPGDRIKLYNASNFFDRNAVPEEDLPAIAKLVGGFESVTVESHVNTIGPRILAFARILTARLEVAVGLETVNPRAMSMLNKRLDLDRFDRAADFLADNDIDLRVFVLLGAPYVGADESVEWTVRTVEFAVGRGARVVSIIPVRGGNGELEHLQEIGEFTPPTLRQLENAFDTVISTDRTIVTADLWDIDRIAKCASCRDARLARLARMNLRGVVEARVSCAVCDAA